MKRIVTALALAASLAGCASNVKPSDIYPSMPANSSFERHITTVWGQTKVIYKTGPDAPK